MLDAFEFIRVRLKTVVRLRGIVGNHGDLQAFDPRQTYLECPAGGA